MSVGVNAFGIIVSTPKNTLFGFTHFFTDVIQVIFGHSKVQSNGGQIYCYYWGVTLMSNSRSPQFRIGNGYETDYEDGDWFWDF